MVSSARRRRRRGRVVAAAMVAFLVGGTVLADRVAHGFAESMAADAVRAGMTATDVDVTINGFPFLTQAVGGTLDDVHLSASSVTLRGLSLTDLDLSATGVSVRSPRGAARVVATGTIPLATVEARVRARTGLDLELRVDGAGLVATSVLAGVPTAVGLAVRPAGTAGLATSVTGVRIAGVDADSSALDHALVAVLDGLDLVDDLPPRADVTAATVTALGIAVTVALDDVSLDGL